MRQTTSRLATQALIQEWRQEPLSVALVPTMGNLHRGHLSLINLARQNAERVVVSIFVNELQFNDPKDFARYPRTLEADIELLSESKVDLAYLPESAELYPHGLHNHSIVHVPEISEILCGQHRPGHFDGVCTVMTKLLHIIQPDCVVLGKKDYQQLLILQKMIDELNFGVKVIAGDTVRETDQLAMSSRNRLLTPQERHQAAELYATLHSLSERYSLANADPLLRECRISLEKSGFRVEYLEVRETETLALPSQNTTEFVVMVAAYLGNIRLIDNVIFQAR